MNSKLDHETYYALVEEAGIRPLCLQLQQLDKKPALRFMLLMEQAYCGSLNLSNYTANGQYDELAYSRDLNLGVFENLKESLKISPSREAAFWEIVLKIFNQQIVFIKNTMLFTPAQKIDLLTFLKRGLKTRRVLDRSIQKISDETIQYIDEAVYELSLQNGKVPAMESNLSGKNMGSGSGKERKQYTTFESLFWNEKHPAALIEFLKGRQILDEYGQWVGMTTNKTEFIGLINALKDPEIGMIRFSSYREVGRLFKSKLNINISDRSLTLHTDTKEEYKSHYLKLLNIFLAEQKLLSKKAR